MNTPDKMERLDALLKENLAPDWDAPPTARDLERARLTLLRGTAAGGRGIERGLTLSGAVLALIEFAALLVLHIIAPPQTLACHIIAGFLLFQTVCLLTCSLGSRAAIRRLRTAHQQI